MCRVLSPAHAQMTTFFLAFYSISCVVLSVQQGEGRARGAGAGPGCGLQAQRRRGGAGRRCPKLRTVSLPFPCCAWAPAGTPETANYSIPGNTINRMMNGFNAIGIVCALPAHGRKAAG